MTLKTKINFKKIVIELFLIFLASALYGLSTVLFIFPANIMLGGTSGVAIILTYVLPFTPGTISVVLNSALILLAFVVLGKGLAIKTFIGSAMTTVSIGVFERIFQLNAPIIDNLYLSAGIGALIIAIASGVMFYVDSSSGGTDIVALIIKRFSNIKIGRALLISDVIIVLIGGILSWGAVFFSSIIGFFIKTLGIDVVIGIIKRMQAKIEDSEAAQNERSDNA